MTSNAAKRFGKTGLDLSRVVFGSTVLGNLFTQPSDEDKRRLVDSWLEASGSPLCIDTAGKYGAGLALEVLGRELPRLGLSPSDVTISNKLAWRQVPLQGSEPTFEPGVWKGLKHDAVQDISREGILRCHEDGCRLLGDYRPKLVAVHDPDEYLQAATDANDRTRRMKDILQAYETLIELRQSGDVVGVGVGSKDWRVIEELSTHVDLDWVMFANSFTIMNHPSELIEFIERLAVRDVGIINSAITHGGFLVGGDYCDYQPVTPGIPSDDRRLAYRDQLTAICGRHNASVFDVCAVFGASHPAIHALAVSSSRPERTAETAAAASTTLPADLWNELRDGGMIAADYPHIC